MYCWDRYGSNIDMQQISAQQFSHAREAHIGEFTRYAATV